jgi:hypothetical protein
VPKATFNNTTDETADRPKSLEEKIYDLSTGTELLLDRLDKIASAGFELPLEEGADVMDECMTARWIAERLDDSVRTILREYRLESKPVALAA